MTTIALVNHSTVLSSTEFQAIAGALQQQVTHLASAWTAVDPRTAVVTVDPRSGLPHGAWLLAILDDSDQANALGYHDFHHGGQPLGKVFARSTLADGGMVSVTCSHEFCELLVDPHINRTHRNGGKSWAIEVCDPVEADSLGYPVLGVTLSDFVTPAWYGMARTAGQGYDYAGHVTASTQLLPGGYASYHDGQGWHQVFADRPSTRAGTSGRGAWRMAR